MVSIKLAVKIMTIEKTGMDCLMMWRGFNFIMGNWGRS